MYETMTYRHVIRKRNNLIYDKKNVDDTVVADRLWSDADIVFRVADMVCGRSGLTPQELISRLDSRTLQAVNVLGYRLQLYKECLAY